MPIQPCTNQCQWTGRTPQGMYWKLYTFTTAAQFQFEPFSGRQLHPGYRPRLDTPPWSWHTLSVIFSPLHFTQLWTSTISWCLLRALKAVHAAVAPNNQYLHSLVAKPALANANCHHLVCSHLVFVLQHNGYQWFWKGEHSSCYQSLHAANCLYSSMQPPQSLLL